jgi:hypothetical protein
MLKKINKKGIALTELLPAFVIVASVFLLIVLMVFVFGVFSESMENTATANTVINESGAYINSTGYQLASGVSGNPRTFSVTTVHNNSDGIIITSGNYTLSSTGLLTNATTTTWEDVNVSYTYNTDSSEITAAKDSQSNITRAIPLVGILFIILAIGALIAILVASLISRKRV